VISESNIIDEPQEHDSFVSQIVPWIFGQKIVIQMKHLKNKPKNFLTDFCFSLIY
jgi:hypothetical protein